MAVEHSDSCDALSELLENPSLLDLDQLDDDLLTLPELANFGRTTSLPHDELLLTSSSGPPPDSPMAAYHVLPELFIKQEALAERKRSREDAASGKSAKRQAAAMFDTPEDDLPAAIELPAADEWVGGQQVEATLPGKLEQQIRFPLPAKLPPVGSTLRVLLPDNTTTYRVELRGHKIQWVARKKLLTVLRNRKSASACRENITNLKAELARLQRELTARDKLHTLLMAPIETADRKPRPLDLNGDGKADAVGYDTTGDGRVDALDTNRDGKIDARIVSIETVKSL